MHLIVNFWACSWHTSLLFPVKSLAALYSVMFPWSNRGQWANNCIVCQHSKVHRHVKAPLAPVSVPGKRFDHMHVGLVFLTSSRGLTEPLGGQRSSRWHRLRQLMWLGHLSPRGSPGSGYRLLSRRIEAPSSHKSFGM